MNSKDQLPWGNKWCGYIWIQYSIWCHEPQNIVLKALVWVLCISAHWCKMARNVAKINKSKNYWSYVSGFDITRLGITSTSRSEKEFDLSAGFRSKAVTKILLFFKQIFRPFLIAVHQNKSHFCNLEAKLDKIRHDWEWKLCVWRFNLIWPDLNSSWVRRKNECFHRILCQKWPIKHVSQRHSHNIFVWLNRWGYT